MLVLTRRPHEAVRIGEEIEVRVLSVEGRKVRLGIEAPDEMLILREEVEDDEVEPDEVEETCE